MTTSKLIRVLLVEDHPAVRQGLRLLLELEGIQVCGEADSIESGRQCAGQCQPDVAMVDLSLGDEDGLELVGHLVRERPGLPLLIYSMFGDSVHVGRALRVGAQAYVTKREASDVLAHAIRECMAGRRYLSPSIEVAPEDPIATLSLQELQIFDLMAEGLNTSSVAARLDLSPRTVETYYRRLQAKLEIHGMKKLRQRAIARRL